MNIVQNRLRSKIEDDFSTHSLIIYIEKEIVIKLSTYAIIDDFQVLK